MIEYQRIRSRDPYLDNAIFQPSKMKLVLDECSPTGFICSGRSDSTNFVCINTVGSYNCHCKPGLDSDGLGECLDWNECFSKGFRCTIACDVVNIDDTAPRSPLFK